MQLAQEKAKFIYEWAESKDYLNPFISEAKFRSTSVATIDLDVKYSAADLCLRLRSIGWVYDIEPYRKLGRNQFRISLFHNIALEDLRKLTQLIDFAIESV